MAIKIEFDGNINPLSPTFVLATRGGEKLGVLNTIDNISVKDNLSEASEISFDLYKSMDGVRCPLWSKVKDFKLVWCKEWDKWFSIEVKITESNSTIKNITATSLGEAELSQIMLYDIEINTEDDIARDDYTDPTVLYHPSKPDCSLLHRILSKTPHYSILHVDDNIANLQRSFSFNNTSIQDAFSEVAEEIGCLFIYNSNSDSDGKISRTISVYDLEQTCLDCGYRGEFTDICPECGSSNIHNGYGKDTTVFVSTENLTDEITYETDTASNKNCFKLTAGDDLMTAAVRSCNPTAGGYIWYITEESREDMSQELSDRLSEYDADYKYYETQAGQTIDAGIINSYNALVDKYSEYNSDLKKLSSPILGYSNLIQADFEVIDFGLFLQTVLMPTPEMDHYTATDQVALLTEDNLSPVAVSDLSDITTTSNVENAIKAMVKTVLDTSQFKFTINTANYSDNVWTGNFTVISYSDEEDAATSSTITISITDDYETYTKQMIDRKLATLNEDGCNIAAIFKQSLDEFKATLKKYCLDSLSEFSSCCQDVLNILVDQGASDKESDLYESVYTPYYEKQKAIQAEVDVRHNEIVILTGDTVTSDDGTETVTTKGLQQYIEEVCDEVRTTLDLENYLGAAMWKELCAYRREDEYSNQNFVSDGLTNSELITNALDFLKKAKKEIYKSAMLQHSISATLNNLLVIPEFKPIVDFFSVGNWIRVRVDDDIYRLRLIGYEVNYSDLPTISVSFSDVTRTANGLSDVASVLSKTSSLSSSFNAVTKQADKGNDAAAILSNWFTNGLSATQTKLVDNASDQNIVIDEHGALFRKLNPVTEQYDDTQIKIVNSTMAITNDNWASSKTAVGKIYYVDPETGILTEAFGINGEALVGRILIGEELKLYNAGGYLIFNDEGHLILSNALEAGSIISDNYNGTDAAPLDNSSGSIILLSDGTFNLGGGSIKWDGKTFSITGYATEEKVDNLEIGSRNYIRNSKTMTYDSYSFVSRGDDTTAYVGSAVVGTNTADEIVITADMLNSMETSTESTSIAIDDVKTTMGI